MCRVAQLVTDDEELQTAACELDAMRKLGYLLKGVQAVEYPVGDVLEQCNALREVRCTLSTRS